LRVRNSYNTKIHNHKAGEEQDQKDTDATEMIELCHGHRWRSDRLGAA